jgi:hypothetical protein
MLGLQRPADYAIGRTASNPCPCAGLRVEARNFGQPSLV